MRTRSILLVILLCASFGAALGQQSSSVKAQAKLKITAPVAHDNVPLGAEVPIRWQFAKLDGNVNIELLRNGASYRSIAKDVTVGSGGRGFYTWVVPAGLTAGSYSIRVVSTSDPTVATDKKINLVSDLPPARFATQVSPPVACPAPCTR